MRWAAAICTPRGSTLTTTGGVLQPLPSIPTTCLVLHTSDKSKTLQSDGDTFKSLSYFLQNFHWSPSLGNVWASLSFFAFYPQRFHAVVSNWFNLWILMRTRVKFAIHRLLSITYVQWISAKFLPLSLGSSSTLRRMGVEAPPLRRLVATWTNGLYPCQGTPLNSPSWATYFK